MFEVGAVSYMGAKSGAGAFQAVIAAMPPHDTYIETHLGTGAVMIRKPPASRSIGIERDAAVLETFSGPVGTELHHGDCVDFLQAFDFAGAGRTLIYADPPYVTATRTGRHRYRFDYDDEDHLRLLAALDAVPAAVMVSGYHSTLYNERLAPPRWRSITFQAMTRGGVRTEVLWMNYPAGGVHWATFAGRDFTDRQRIKRKAARWATDYRQLPPAERLAILAALLDVEGEARPT